MKKVLISLGLLLCVLAMYYSHQSKDEAIIPPLPIAKNAIGTKERPQARMEYEKSMLVDPGTNQIPVNIHRKELEFSKTLRANQNANSRKRTLEWTNTGPYNIGGRTRALALDMRNEEIIIAGGVSGGVWHSQDGGQNWLRATQPNVLNSVTCISQDPRIGKQDTWYFGTGELRGNSARAPGAPYRGDGIFKSTDGGQSWDIIPSTSTENASLFDSPFNYVWNLAQDPTAEFENDVIYAAIYGNIVRSLDGGQNWASVLGEPNLLESTSEDLNLAITSFYTNVLITPGGKIYAYLSSFTGNTFTTANKGIWYSENGENWRNITPVGFTSQSERLVMNYAPNDENLIYFLVEGASTQLWRYDNGSWRDLSAYIPDGNTSLEAYDSQSSYNMTIAVHPKNSEVVFLGGTNLYRSTDGFTSSQNVDQIGGYDTEDFNQIYENHHPDQHAVVFLDDADKMVTANDGGLFKTFNNRASSVSWSSLNNGYVTSQFYSIALSKVEGNDQVIGGLQDNGTYIKSGLDSTTDWVNVLGGDGAYCASTPGDLYWYASFQEAGIFKISFDSDDNIETWAKVDPKGIMRNSYLFIAPFVLDPNNYHRMYLAGDSAIWRNDNLSQIKFFKQVETDTHWQVISNVNDNENITAIDISTSTANVLWYGTNTGKVYRVQNANWPEPTTELMFDQENGYVASICIDPDDNDRILISYANYHIRSVFFSTDGGISFEDIGGNLEESPDGSGNGPSIRWAEIIPMDDGTYQYYLGTSIGLYSTDDLDGSNTVWIQEGSETIGRSVVTMLDYRSSDGQLIAATHGNGIFKASIGQTKEIIPENVQSGGITLMEGYPNPFSDEFKIKFKIPRSGSMELYISDLSGKNVRTISSTPQFAGDITMIWDGNNNSGGNVKNGLYHYVIIYEGNAYGGNIMLLR